MTNTNEAVLRDALENERTWLQNQRKAISKGCGSSWDMMQCDERINLINAALAATATVAKDGGAAECLNVMLWLYRRLPRAYERPPHIEQPIKALANKLGVPVDDCFAERGIATHQPDASAEQPAGEVVAAISEDTGKATPIILDEDHPEAARWYGMGYLDGTEASTTTTSEDTGKPNLHVCVEHDPAGPRVVVHDGDRKIYDEIYTITPAAPATTCSIGDDAEFCRLQQESFCAEHEWRIGEEISPAQSKRAYDNLVAYIDTRAAASRNAAPSPTGESLSARDAVCCLAAETDLNSRDRYVRDSALDDAACLVLAGCGYNWQSIAEAIRALKTVPGEPT